MKYVSLLLFFVFILFAEFLDKNDTRETIIDCTFAIASLIIFVGAELSQEINYDDEDN